MHNSHVKPTAAPKARVHFIFSAKSPVNSRGSSYSLLCTTASGTLANRERITPSGDAADATPVATRGPTTMRLGGVAYASWMEINVWSSAIARRRSQ